MSEGRVTQRCDCGEIRMNCDCVEPWATRIPAAIKRAEELLSGRSLKSWGVLGGETMSVIGITREEVALAKALWTDHAEPGADHSQYIEEQAGAPCDSCTALIAFTEKVEVLDG